MTQIKITSEFDLNNAHVLAQLSELAYEDEQTLRNRLIRYQFQRCEFITVDQIQCYLAEHQNYYVISFRGTEIANIEDWITNLKFELTHHTMGQVHFGFDRGLNKVWSDLKHQVVQRNKKPIFITGHSQGAALAGLCAARLRLSGIEVQAVFTYGQPRIGNKSFQEHYDRFLKNRSFRIVNNNDVVSRVPPRALNYKHCGTLQYFTEDGELSSDISDWSRFLDRMHGRVDDVLQWGTDGIKDHNIGEYVRLCEQALNCEPAT